MTTLEHYLEVREMEAEREVERLLSNAENR